MILVEGIVGVARVVLVHRIRGVAGRNAIDWVEGLPIDAAQRKVVLLELWNGGWKTDSHEETCKRLGEVF